jgi:hypothetical protein
MFSRIERTRRSNHSIFLPQNFGSPFNDTAEHVTGLGPARIDFERCAVAGEVIYSVEGDSIPISRAGFNIDSFSLSFQAVLMAFISSLMPSLIWPVSIRLYPSARPYFPRDPTPTPFIAKVL